MHKSFIRKTLITIAMTAALTLTTSVPSFAVTGDLPKAPKLDCTSAILMDAKSGEILYEKNAYEQRDPASVTKILTCMVALEHLDLDEVVTVDYQPVSEGTSIHLQEGETMSVRDIVYGMMVKSGNDAAEYLAYKVAGNIPDFCDMMNEKAKACGAKNTKFNNPNGLNPKEVNNLTTAYDLAVISREAMKDPQFRDIVQTAKLTIEPTNKSEKRKYKNSNRCLWDKKHKAEINGVETPFYYEGCIGVKTGYSSTAGNCFAGYVTRNGQDFITVVMNAPHEKQRYTEAIKLWDYAFANFRTYTAAKSGDVQDAIRVKRGSLAAVDIGLAEDCCITVTTKETPEETVKTEVVTTEETLEAPIKKGTVLGELVVYNNGEEATRQSLVALEEVEKGGPLSCIGIPDEYLPIFIIVLITALLIIILIWILRVRKRNEIRRKKREERRQQRNENV